MADMVTVHITEDIGDFLTDGVTHIMDMDGATHITDTVTDGDILIMDMVTGMEDIIMDMPIIEEEEIQHTLAEPHIVVIIDIQVAEQAIQIAEDLILQTEEDHILGANQIVVQITVEGILVVLGARLIAEEIPLEEVIQQQGLPPIIQDQTLTLAQDQAVHTEVLEVVQEVVVVVAEVEVVPVVAAVDVVADNYIFF